MEVLGRWVIDVRADVDRSVRFVVAPKSAGNDRATFEASAAGVDVIRPMWPRRARSPSSARRDCISAPAKDVVANYRRAFDPPSPGHRSDPQTSICMRLDFFSLDTCSSSSSSASDGMPTM